MLVIKEVASTVYVVLLMTFWFLAYLIAKPLAWFANLITDLLYLISPNWLVRWCNWVCGIWLSIGDNDDEKIS